MLEVQVSTQGDQIQVALPSDSTLRLPDTWNNRRLLMVLLRLLEGRYGKPLMTFAQIAQAFGYKDRRNVHNFWREFEQSGQDVLDYLQRQYKIDQTIRDTIVAVFLEDLLAATPAITAEVQRRLRLGPRGLSETTVSYVLGDLLRMQAKVKRMLADGQAHVRDRFLIEELFGLVEEGAARIPDNSPWREEKVEHLKEATGGRASDPAPAVIPSDQALRHQMTKKEGTVAAWAQEYVWLFLLYWHGISAAKLGKWFGLHKTTVWRRVVKFSTIGVLAAGLVAGVASHVIGVDEKWIRIGGKWHHYVGDLRRRRSR